MEENPKKKRVHPIWAFVSLFLAAQIGRFLLTYIFPTFIELSKGMEINGLTTALHLGLTVLMALISVEACLWIREKISTPKQVAMASAMVTTWAFFPELSIIAWLPGLIAAAISVGCYKLTPRSVPKSFTILRLLTAILGFSILHQILHNFLVSKAEAVTLLSGPVGSFLGWLSLALVIRVVWLCFALARNLTGSQNSVNAAPN